jgi:hypothetical protein
MTRSVSFEVALFAVCRGLFVVVYLSWFIGHRVLSLARSVSEGGSPTMPENEREAELNGARRPALLQRQPAIAVLPRSRFGLGKE